MAVARPDLAAKVLKFCRVLSEMIDFAVADAQRACFISEWPRRADFGSVIDKQATAGQRRLTSQDGRRSKDKQAD